MMDDNKNIFKKISITSERDEVLLDLAKAGAEMICKGSDETLYKVVANRFEKRLLICKMKSGEKFPDFTYQDIITCFFLGGYKYFFQAKCKTVANELVFDFPFDIFQLQRRQSYRLIIPSSFKSTILITSHKKMPVNIRGDIHDLSTGGCRINLNQEKTSSSHFEMDDLVEVTLQFSGRDALTSQAFVRYIKGQTLGLEFFETSPKFEAKVFSITMDLHKEFFSHL